MKSIHKSVSVRKIVVLQSVYPKHIQKNAQKSTCALYFSEM